MAKWHCELGCDKWLEFDDLEQVNDHIRVLHPDTYGTGPERWPDNGIVVYDDTLEPTEFGDAGA